MGNTNTRPSRIIIAAITIILIGGLIWVLSKSDAPTIPAKVSAEENPLGKLEQFVYTRTINGDVKWEMRAKEAMYFQKTNELRLAQVEGMMSTPARRITLKGERGRIDLETKTGFLEGGVVGRSDDGYVLYTARLEFDASSRVVSTDEAILLEGEHLTLQGIGMELNLDEQTFKLHQQVKATLRPGGDS